MQVSNKSITYYLSNNIILKSLLSVMSSNKTLLVGIISLFIVSNRVVVIYQFGLVKHHLLAWNFHIILFTWLKFISH